MTCSQNRQHSENAQNNLILWNAHLSAEIKSSLPQWRLACLIAVCILSRLIFLASRSKVCSSRERMLMRLLHSSTTTTSGCVSWTVYSHTNTRPTPDTTATPPWPSALVNITHYNVGLESLQILLHVCSNDEQFKTNSFCGPYSSTTLVSKRQRQKRGHNTPMGLRQGIHLPDIGH